MLTQHYRDIVFAFIECDVRFLLVGAHAKTAHGIPRATQDIDLWVEPTISNAEKVMQALKKFGAPLFDLTEVDLAQLDTVFQIGVDPVRIDVMTSVSGVEFSEAWPKRVAVKYEGIELPLMSLELLMVNKVASNRPKDRIDVKTLARRLGISPPKRSRKS